MGAASSARELAENPYVFGLGAWTAFQLSFGDGLDGHDGRHATCQILQAISMHGQCVCHRSFIDVSSTTPAKAELRQLCVDFMEEHTPDFAPFVECEPEA